MHVAWLLLALWNQGRGSRMTKNAYFSFLTHAKKFLLVAFCDTTAGIESMTELDGKWTDRREILNSYVFSEIKTKKVRHLIFKELITL